MHLNLTLVRGRERDVVVVVEKQRLQQQRGGGGRRRLRGCRGSLFFRVVLDTVQRLFFLPAFLGIRILQAAPSAAGRGTSLGHRASRQNDMGRRFQVVLIFVRGDVGRGHAETVVVSDVEG